MGRRGYEIDTLTETRQDASNTLAAAANYRARNSGRDLREEEGEAEYPAVP